MSHNQNLAGLPDWADDQTAADTVAALGLDTAAASLNGVGDGDRRKSWAHAAQYYWAAAYLALDVKDYRAVSTAADQARHCLDRADPMLNAVFGGPGHPSARVAAKGASLPADQVSAARKAVLAHLKNQTAKNKADQKAARQKAAVDRKSQTVYWDQWRADDKAQRAAANKAAADKAAADARNKCDKRLADARALLGDLLDALANHVGGVVVDGVAQDAVTLSSGGTLVLSQTGTVLDDAGNTWTLLKHSADAAVDRGVVFAVQNYSSKVGV